MSYTPGPWNLKPETRSTSIYVGGDLTRGMIARVYDKDGKGEQEANARLIAAAPKLLEALEEFMLCRMPNGDGTWSKCPPNDGDFELAAKVIAKAKGKTKKRKHCYYAHSDMTPCAFKDGDCATLTDGHCVGCGADPKQIKTAGTLG